MSLYRILNPQQEYIVAMYSANHQAVSGRAEAPSECVARTMGGVESSVCGETGQGLTG